MATASMIALARARYHLCVAKVRTRCLMVTNKRDALVFKQLCRKISLIVHVLLCFGVDALQVNALALVVCAHVVCQTVLTDRATEGVLP